MAEPINWHQDIFDVLREQDFTLIAHVPDAGHTPLIKMCEANNEMEVVTLTTEEEGVGLVSGAWAGGRKGVLLMQSSGVGNCANALALPAVCRIPFLLSCPCAVNGVSSLWQCRWGRARRVSSRRWT